MRDDNKKLPAGWEVKRLGEVAAVKGGKRVPKGYKFENRPTNFPYISVTEFSDEGSIDSSKLKYISEQVFKEIQNYTISTKDIYISIAGTIGKTGIVPKALDGANLTENACKLVLQSCIDQKFLYYFTLTNSFDEQALSNTRVSAQPKLSLERLKTITLNIPPLPEQKHIVAILDESFCAIAKAKENAEKNLANARELFEGYLNQVFANPGEDWEEKKLGEVCVGVEYGTSAKSQKTGKIPVLRMGNIQDGTLDWTNLVYTSDEIEIKKYILRKNDILFNRTNSPELVGKTVIFKGEQPAIFAGYLIRININEKLIDADFLNICLNSKKLRNYGFSVMISSVNQANISGSKLKEYPLVLPSLLEQKNIVLKLDTLSLETKKLERIYQQKISSLDELKKSILDKAFKGEL